MLPILPPNRCGGAPNLCGGAMMEGATKAEGEARPLYALLHDMAATFAFQPGVRINEVELARRLSVSRTPLRESLQRLVSEGFLIARPNKGFFCRELDPRQI